MPPKREVHNRQIPPSQGKSHRQGSLFRPALTICLIALFFALGCLVGMIGYFQRDLPSISQLERYEPSLITKIYSADNRLLKEFYTQRRFLVPLERMPPHLIDAVIDTEDRRFWDHWGMDLRRVAGALWANLRAGEIVQGASTLTQQLARNLFLTGERTLIRKAKEVLTALRIEKAYSKREILQMYLNQQYFGHGAYGVQAAAQLYFSKDVEDLELTECALLAGLLKGPASYSPINHPEKALQRRNLVLRSMAECGHITATEADSAMKASLGLNLKQGKEGEAQYFVEHVRQQLEEKYGSKILYQDGVSVYTTLDPRLQHIAEKAMKGHLSRLQERIEAQQEAVDTVTVEQGTAQIDSIYTHRVQGALVAIDPRTGEIKAMVGGRNFKESKFNRATQAHRQPGSSFKPFVFTAAIDNGYRPTDIILDTPIVIPTEEGQLWRPYNYDSTFGGPTTLRDGLRRSRNLVAIKLLQQIGPKQVAFYAEKMGIRSELRPVLSLAIGTSEVTLLELTSAYSVLANGGIRVEPTSILRIVDREGNIIEENHPRKKEVLSAQTAYMMTNMLQSVIDAGTGYGARRAGFVRPAAGKTGTTDNFTDAWFIGFTPYLVTGVWVGFDDQRTLGDRQAGSVVALPVWAAFMKAAHDTLRLPPTDFKVPTGIVKKRVCKRTLKLARKYCPNTYLEVFIQGTEPTEYCQKHIPVVEGGLAEPDRFELEEKGAKLRGNLEF